MFMEDERKYERLRRAENLLGWMAICMVAALVFMFAGFMNAASATASPKAASTSSAITSPQSGHASPLLPPSSLPRV